MVGMGRRWRPADCDRSCERLIGKIGHGFFRKAQGNSSSAMAIAIALEQNMRLACLALGGRQLRLLGELRLAYQLSEWIDRCLLGKTRTTRSKAATLLGPFRSKALLGLFAILFAIDLVLGCLRLDGRRRA